MARIRDILLREVLDSRGRPTIEADCVLTDGTLGRAIAPSGASTGTHESVERRDADPRRHRGLGTRRVAAAATRAIAPVLRGRDPARQADLDAALRDLDGTADLSRLGGNAVVAVSMAMCRAAATAQGIPLYQWIRELYRRECPHGTGRRGVGASDRLSVGASPPQPVRLRPSDPPTLRRSDTQTLRHSDFVLPLPMVNMISGGLHGGSGIEMQDLLMVPLRARTTVEALEQIAAVYLALKDLLAKRFPGWSGVADEGGFGPPLRTHEEGLRALVGAFRRAGLRPGRDAAIALDVAATHFHAGRRYRLRSEGRTLDAKGMVDLLERWCDRYPIVSIEDPLAEDDWDGWVEATERLGRRVQLVGDDLFVTNTRRLALGIRNNVANAVLVKINQNGTVAGTLGVVAGARASGYRTVISARSGESEDPFLADLAVGCAGGQIKIGSIARSERGAKYNQLLRIEEQLGPRARLATWGFQVPSSKFQVPSR